MKTKSFKMNRLFVLAVALMTISVNAWGGSTYTITFITSSSDGSSPMSNSTQVSNVVTSASVAYVDAIGSGCVRAYNKSKNGVKLGSGSGGGTLELILPTAYQANIKTITINTVQYSTDNATFTLYNGDTQLKTNIPLGEDTYTFTDPTTIERIKISTSGSTRAYVSSIVLVTGESSTASIKVKNSSNEEISAIDFGNVSVTEGEVTINVSGTCVQQLSDYTIGYAITEGDDNFYVNETEYISGSSGSLKIAYIVDEDGEYNGTLQLSAWKGDACKSYDYDMVTRDIPLSVTYTAACTSISPKLSYNNCHIGDTPSPTLTGNTGNNTVTYSITSGGSYASINSSTGVVTANAAGSVTVKASIAKGNGYCAGEASATFTISCTSISPTLSYASAATIGGADLTPTLNKGGSDGSVTYSIKNGGSYATINSSTGALHATAAGDVTVQAQIAASGAYCSGSAVSNTISITAAPVYHTVTWKVNGDTFTTTENVSSGSTVDAPAYTSELPCGDKLVGWTTTEDYFHASSQPGDLFTTTSPAITADVTFYAVFADRQE